MKKKAVKFILLFFLFSFFLFLISFLALAEERKLEVEYPEIFGIKPETVKTGLPEYAKYIFNFGIVIIGLVVLGALIRGGFLYLTSTGQPVKLQAAKEQIFSAFLGIVILLSSYIILTTINPQLVIFHLPPLKKLEEKRVAEPEPLKPEEMSLISRELPLGQAVEEGLWEEKRTNKTKGVIEDFESFLSQEIKVSPTFNKIADLNKYLKTLTDECQCGYLDTFCTKPENWGVPIGCSGDPCPEETRKKIKKVLEINAEKMEKLLEFQKKIIEEKIALEVELGKFTEVEQETLACQTQTKELFNLNEHLARVQFFEEQGWTAATVPSYLESRADPLTFYCSAGGTVFDYPYSPQLEFTPEELTPIEIPEELTLPEPISCPAEFPVGEIVDQARELAVLLSVKLERTVILIEEMVKEIRNMAGLVSQCNEQNCSADCACVPNPCYECCSPIPCGPCVPSCLSPCLQAVGQCAGIPCPRGEIEDTVKKIKEIEDEIFATIKDKEKGIKQIFPQATSLLKDEENPLNLNNIRTAVGLCSGPQTEQEPPTWMMLNCEMAIGNYGPDGQIIGNCHPRNFYCCSSSKEALAQPPFPSAVEKPPSYILPPKKYEPLTTEDNCPKGWLCKSHVKYYNQYQDASEPLKELLSCMRERLDKVQKEKEIENILGRISDISDEKLYTGECDWEAGPKAPGGCVHPYGIRNNKEHVSAHYGGRICRYQRASYAVDVGVNLYPYERKYADEIISAAKECQPAAFVLYRAPGHYDHIHISLGAVYHCGGN